MPADLQPVHSEEDLIAIKQWLKKQTHQPQTIGHQYEPTMNSEINSLVEPGKPFFHFWKAVFFPEEYKNRTLIVEVWNARRDLLQSAKLLKQMAKDQVPIKNVADTLQFYKCLSHGSMFIGSILLTELLAKVSVMEQLVDNTVSSDLQEMASMWSEQNLSVSLPPPPPPRRSRRRRRVIPPAADAVPAGHGPDADAVPAGHGPDADAVPAGDGPDADAVPAGDGPDAVPAGDGPDADAVPAGDGPDIGLTLPDQQDLGPVQLDQPSIHREHLIPEELPSTSAVHPSDFGDDEDSRRICDEIAIELREFTLVNQVTPTSEDQPPSIQVPTSSAAVAELPVPDVEQPVPEVATPRRRPRRPRARQHEMDHFVPRRHRRSLPFVEGFIFNYEDAIGALADLDPPERLLIIHRDRLMRDQPDVARPSESPIEPPAVAPEEPSVAEPIPVVPDIEPPEDVAEIQPAVAPEEPSVAEPIPGVPDDIEPPVPEIQENEFGSAQQLIDVWAREHDGTELGVHENGLIKHLLRRLDDLWRNQNDAITMTVLCPSKSTRRSVSARAFNIVIHFLMWKIVDVKMGSLLPGQQFKITNIKPGRKVIHIYSDIVL